MSERKKTNLKRSIKFEGRVVTLVLLPLISLLLGIGLSFIVETTLQDNIIITLLLTVTFLLFENNLKNHSTAERLAEDNKKIELKISDLKLLSTIQEGLLKTKHPYFRKWGFLKLEKFIEDNQEFFEGTNRTNPHSEDTFGIEGIKATNNYGTLRCISAVEDYWEDSFTKEYLRVQADLIKIKNVRIQRIFILCKENYDRVYQLMHEQYKVGIEVYYIFKDNQYINKTWLKEDYLIQDDKLLVEIFCENHKYSEEETSTELITIVPSVVNKKVDRFMRILERSERFTPEVKTMVQHNVQDSGVALTR